MKLLVDTNVLIDLIAQRKPFVDHVRTLCIASKFGDVQMWVSTQSFMYAYYVLGKSCSEQEVKSALLASLEFFLPFSIPITNLKPALESDWHDIEDYMIAFSADSIYAEAIITRDEALIEKSPVKAMTAESCIEMLKSEYGLTYEEIDFA